jgi:DNA-binding NarL/FixJ family response regulator
MVPDKIHRVVVADDHALFMDGITSLLEAAGYEIVGQARNGPHALEVIRLEQPDLVLLDITMPEMSGLEVLAAVKTEFPAMRVVMLTVSDADDDLLAAIQFGADGYLLKDLNSEMFIRMLAGLERDEAALTPQMTTRLMSGFQELARQTQKTKNDLTEREIDLLNHMAGGFSNKVIAKKLFISENTVKYHIRNILQKLGVQNRTEAVRAAIRRGYLQP